MSFPVTKLGEVTDKIGSGVTPRGGDAVYVSEGASLIRSQNIYNSQFTQDGLVFLDEKTAQKMKGVTVLKDDVLLNITGDSVARCCKADERFLPARVNQHVAIIRPNKDRLNPDFLMFYLTSPYMQIKMLSWAGSGGTRKALTKGMIKGFEVPTPDIEVQNQISEVLKVYNNLIENNKRRIELLEESAQQLYKEWFVRFRFPGHEHVEIIDGVPEGWAIETIKDVCSKFVDGDWIESKDQGSEDFRILQISNIGVDNFVETGNHRFVSERTFHRLNCDEVLPGDFLLARMPKHIGRAWMVTEMPWRMVTAVDVTITRNDPAKVNQFYLLYHLNSAQHIARCEAGATGATRPRVSRRVMGGLPILLPPEALQTEFSEFAEGIHYQKQNLQKQTVSLQKARDLLLPKLMNGEVAV